MLDPFILTFQSEHTWDVNSATHELLSKHWNITDSSDGHQLFLLMLCSDLEYDARFGYKINTESMKTAYHNILSGSSNGDYLPESFKNNSVDDCYEGQSGDNSVTLYNQQVMLLDRGSDQTIVVINNHSSWITDLWSGDPTLSMANIHKEQWLFRHKFFEEFNVIIFACYC